MQEYEPIRQQLLKRYREINERLSRITQDVRHTKEPLAADFEEQAIERENDEVLTALDDSIRRELRQIQVTLGRLDRGEYGICESCGRKIPLKRLRALPFASRCVACAEEVQR
ncbi:MAG TPA: TraR/DksA C4-type zinc finger protein [Blastocatellia bacterium]|nr:TraR/DksA C4-type zinc finger protein [Blastocatellia bacterium]